MPNIDIAAIFRAAASESLLAENTRKAYALDWSLFARWSVTQSLPDFPASSDTLMRYLSERLVEGGRVSSAVRAVTAINHYHRQRQAPSPGTREVYRFLSGVRRMKSERPKQKRPISVEDLKRICALFGDDPRHVRARAILILGFASALRRSNIVALDLEDVTFAPEGLALRIRQEKTDQEGEGRVVGVVRGQCADTCPVRAVEAWLKIRNSQAGPLFVAFNSRLEPTDTRLCARQVAVTVKRSAGLIGLDGKAYAGHSLRSGFVTSAILGGAGEFLVAEQTGHRSLGMLRQYYRNARPFARNASALLGL
jgi:integrase